MEKLQVDNDYYKLYAPDTLRYITEPMEEILPKKIKELCILFGIDKFRKIQINYFDDLDKFRNFIISMREDGDNNLPEYARGTYDNGMINAFIENNLIEGSKWYNSRLYSASHELFHIMYKELILNNDYDKRIIWYDEGMAQFMSGEKDYLLDEENFSEYLSRVIENTKVIPNLNDLEHGPLFQNDLYNGYDLSYLAIRYLKENLSDKDFQDLLKDFAKIKMYGKSIIEDAFEYYDKKYKFKDIKIK